MTRMSLASRIHAVSHLTGEFVLRKTAKPYDTRRLAEGADIVGRQVLVIEDIVTSGGQIALSTGELRTLGARVDHALCVIDRQQGGTEALATDGINLLSLLTGADLETAAAGPAH